MTIRVRCKCGKSLKIEERLAGRKLSCPACERPFRIPAEKFEAVRRRRSDEGTPVAPKSDVALPASLDEDLTAAGSGAIALSQDDLPGELKLQGDGAESEAAPAALTVLDGPNEVAYAADPTARIQGDRRVADPISGPKRGFFADMGTSFIYPCKSVNNLVTLAIVFAVSAAGDLCSVMPNGCFMIFVKFLVWVIIGGWFASMYFAVIQETASGSEDMPGLTLEDGWWDGIFAPAFRYLGAIAVVLAPAIFLTIAEGAGRLPSFMTSLIPIWFIGGVFLLPMSMMLFAFRSASTIFRLDLVLVTIAKTILPYLAIWGMLLLVSVLIVLAQGGATVLSTLIGVSLVSMSAGGFLSGLAMRIVLSWISVYFTIVAMRTIGLYYLHFKRRFVFIME
ncbi:MAG TPA: hypothetical protein P5081_12870 [Phycisphaerae bacterium]|nr:hypothetical protein [Phycisphaerae bacterium]HRW53770.1 hypothetical protein [Phycisphaerae bacterium]